jgi:hypothetical protein
MLVSAVIDFEREEGRKSASFDLLDLDAVMSRGRWRAR